MEGPRYLYKSSKGFIWWTLAPNTLGYYHEIFGLWKCYITYPYCHFVTEAPNTIYFSAKGSVRVGITEEQSIDVNGDHSVDMADISLLIDSFVTRKEEEGYSELYDLIRDYVIDMGDISILIEHFMEHP